MEHGVAEFLYVWVSEDNSTWNDVFGQNLSHTLRDPKSQNSYKLDIIGVNKFQFNVIQRKTHF